MLVTFGTARVAGRSLHADEDRIIGIPWRFVLADIHRNIQIHLVVIHARRGDTSNSEFFKGPPISDGDSRVNQRDFDAVVKRLLLRVGQLRTEIRDHHVPTRENGGFSSDGTELAVS